MKKNIKNSLNNLKDVLNSLLSSKKLMAAILAPLSLSLIACPSGNEDEGGEVTPPGPVVTYTEEDVNYALLKVSGADNIKANDVKTIVDNLSLTFTWDHVSRPNVGEIKTEPKENVFTYANLPTGIDKSKIIFKVDGNTVNYDDSFTSEQNQNMKLEVSFNEKSFSINFINGKYEDGQGGGNDNPDPKPNPNEKYTDVTIVLKEILGDSYDTISGEISNNNINLTAQTIDAVTDIFPALKNVVNAATEETATAELEKAKAIVESSNAKLSADEKEDMKKALVAQNKDKISLTKTAKEYLAYNGEDPWDDCKGYGYDITAKGDMKISLTGDFKYLDNHIESLNGNVDISNVTIVSQGYLYVPMMSITAEEIEKEIYNKLKLKDKNEESSLPALDFTIVENGEFGLKHFLDIFSKYYTLKDTDKLKGTIPFSEIDGRKLVDGVNEDNYTLFNSKDDTAKSSNDSSIKSFNVNELAAFTNKYNGITKVKNVIILGTPNPNTKVNWDITNVIFENDMSNLTNTLSFAPKGIVYFMDLPYNNKEVELKEIEGIVKLNKLSDNFKTTGGLESVLDIRDVPEDSLTGYNTDYKNCMFDYMGVVYFNEKFKTYARDSNGDFKADFYRRFYNPAAGRLYNEHFGNGDRKNSYLSSKEFISSKTPRKLSEFEYYGNNFKYKKPAYDTYEENFDGLSTTQYNKLENDKTTGQNKIAKVDFVDPDTKKIILSVLKDRQYNV